METQNKTKFEPSAEHIVFADAYILHKGNISAACRELGTEHRNIYYIRYKPTLGFEEWLSAYCKQEVLKRSGKWYLIAEKHAEAGSFQHLSMLMQIGKEFAPGAIVDQSHNITWNVNVNTEEGRFAKRFESKITSEPS